MDFYESKHVLLEPITKGRDARIDSSLVSRSTSAPVAHNTLQAPRILRLVAADQRASAVALARVATWLTSGTQLRRGVKVAAFHLLRACGVV